MSALDYNTVEAELREIESDFAGGRLGAFGSAASQEEVMREFGKVGQLEVQVFIRTCAQIRALSEEEGLVQRTLREHAGANCSAAHQRTGSRQAEKSDTPPPDGETAASAAGENVTSPGGISSPVNRQPPSMGSMAGASASFAGNDPAMSGMNNASMAGGEVWSLHGSTDKAFEDMAKLFKAKEAALKASADNLRQMAKHINNANDVLQRAHSPTA
jgi:hypothetical protein